MINELPPILFILTQDTFILYPIILKLFPRLYHKSIFIRITFIKGVFKNILERVLNVAMLHQLDEDGNIYYHTHGPALSFEQQNLCLHQLFENQVKLAPAKPALIYEGQKLTYQQLNQRANLLAHQLINRGIKQGACIGLCLEHSFDMLVGILGILKAGGAYVPLDPTYPQERLRYILQDASISLVVTQNQFVEILSTFAISSLNLDHEKLSGSTIYDKQQHIPDPELPLSNQNVAYVIYTSGSTGKPKGVMVSHANVMRLLEAVQPWFQFNEQDIWTLFHSFAFDFSVWEIWGALRYGGTLVIVPYTISRSPHQFYELLCTEHVTVLNQTPSAFRHLLVEDERDHLAQSPLSLRLLIFGGEALNLHDVDVWFQRHGDVAPQLVNMYGITETTVHVTYCPLSYLDIQAGINCIGVPIPDLQVYLLDEYGNLTPAGIVGELYVGGPGLAHGYLNRPDLTAERFVPHFLADKPGMRLYRTGDLGRYLPNGKLEYLGRSDQQVKLRGYRIELGEIEAVLHQHSNVEQCKVLIREDTFDDKRLVAYILSKDLSASKNLEQLRPFLEKRLPTHMVPNNFILLNEWPLTSNNKIDIQALPIPDQTRPIQPETFVPPHNTTEFALANIWRDVLGLDQVGVYDNFFVLGGHSLLATQILSRIHDIFGLEIPFSAFFTTATIDGMSRFIDDLTEHKADIVHHLPLIVQPHGVLLPLSFAQQRLWFLDQLNLNTSWYNIALILHIRGSLDIALLQDSINQVIQRHESLRTIFFSKKVSHSSRF